MPAILQNHITQKGSQFTCKLCLQNMYTHVYCKTQHYTILPNRACSIVVLVCNMEQTTVAVCNDWMVSASLVHLAIGCIQVTTFWPWKNKDILKYTFMDLGINNMYLLIFLIFIIIYTPITLYNHIMPPICKGVSHNERFYKFMY